MEKVPPAEAANLIGRGALILDVRTEREFAAGHIGGAKLIPVQDLERRMGELEGLREKPILVYCRSGRRSAIAAGMMREAGFTELYDLEGGLITWRREGLALTAKE